MWAAQTPEEFRHLSQSGTQATTMPQRVLAETCYQGPFCFHPSAGRYVFHTYTVYLHDEVSRIRWAAAAAAAAHHQRMMEHEL